MNRFSVLAALGLCLSSPVFADDAADDADTDAAVRSFVDSLHFRDGAVAVGAAHARFDLGDRFRFLEQADARRVLEDFWGNPPDDSVLGLVVPADADLAADSSWAVVVTYSDDGYVSDEDAAKIDYDELLASMQEDTADGNEARVQAGYSDIALLGWAEPPKYEATSHKLYWAKALAFDHGQSKTLNYDVRVLGRHGYMSLNAVAGMEQLDQVRSGMRDLLPRADFDDGFRYADYDASSDKVAAYGLAALVAGGVAAKAGLFGKLFAILLAAKKLIIGLIALIGAGIAKLFKRKAA